MFPLLFHYGDFFMPAFFTFVMIGILICVFYLYKKAPALGFSQVAVLDIGMIGAVTGILGARIYHVLVEYPMYYWEDPWRFTQFWAGGFVSYGAYIGGALGVLTYLKARRLPVLDYADFVATAIPILVVFIRIGCIGAGCCYGTPTDFFIHLVFPGPQYQGGPPVGVPLHATQVYDLLSGVLWFVVLNWLYKRRQFQGQILTLLFIGYSAVRFFIEFLRGDEDRGLWFGNTLSSAQITGAIAIVLMLGLYFVLRKKYPLSPASTPKS